MPCPGSNYGPGAYTGLVIHGKQAQYVGSTFQQKAFPRTGAASRGDHRRQEGHGASAGASPSATSTG